MGGGVLTPQLSSGAALLCFSSGLPLASGAAAVFRRSLDTSGWLLSCHFGLVENIIKFSGICSSVLSRGLPLLKGSEQLRPL